MNQTESLTLTLGSFSEKMEIAFDNASDEYLNALLLDFQKLDLKTTPILFSENDPMRVDLKGKSLKYINKFSKYEDICVKLIAKTNRLDIDNALFYFNAFFPLTAYSFGDIKKKLIQLVFSKNRNFVHNKYMTFLHSEPHVLLSSVVDFYCKFLKDNNCIDLLDNIFLEYKNKIAQNNSVSSICSFISYKEEILDGVFSKEQSNQLLETCIVHLKTKKTEELLKNYRSYDRYNNLSDLSYSILKNILDEREHIPNKSQKKLIRQMSAKSKKKLTLKEAQILKNTKKRK